MPRKQRFKPSRKPATTPPPPQPPVEPNETGSEVHPDDIDFDRNGPRQGVILAEDAHVTIEPDSSR